jgi:4-amino-4-deoxy-L-arabinose transferase-like glycosyltransferase
VPNLAGEPFMEKPPLFYWLAAVCARLFSSVMPLHDGARLASGLSMLIACTATAAAARQWWGARTGRYAALGLIGCVGSLEQAHLMMPDIALLAGFAISALGFATVRSEPVRGGLLLGAALTVAFLAKGLLGPLVMSATALCLPLLFSEWRLPEYWRALGIAVLISGPLGMVWPVWLYLRSPDLFMDWFWLNNVGRFVGFSVPQLRTEHLPWFWTKTLPWYTFPALPLALWTLWGERRQAFTAPAVQYCVVAFSVLMSVLALSSSARCVYAWPLLVPLAMLAGLGAQRLPVRADRLLRWAAALIFAACTGAVVLGWSLMMLTGVPPDWPALLRLLPDAFVPRFEADSQRRADGGYQGDKDSSIGTAAMGLHVCFRFRNSCRDVGWARQAAGCRNKVRQKPEAAEL